MSLQDKVAIVTGGTGGIGSAIVRHFVEAGAKVVISDIEQDKGLALAAELGSEEQVVFFACDVSDRLDVHNLVASTLGHFGQIDILINNAGITHTGNFLELAEEDYDRVLSVNLKGMFLCGQEVARHMIETVEAGGKPGAIVNMSSINDTVAIPAQFAYCVSKGGVSQLTRTMALTLASYGIRVNAIGPGSIMTDMLKSVNENPDAMNMVMSRTPMGRIGEAQEIASIAAFLGSDAASYVTGATLYADGGRMPLNYTVPV